MGLWAMGRWGVGDTPSLSNVTRFRLLFDGVDLSEEDTFVLLLQLKLDELSR